MTAKKLDHPTTAATPSTHKVWAQEGLYGHLPAHAVAPITAHNASEFGQHYGLPDLIGVSSDLCDLHSVLDGFITSTFHYAAPNRGKPVAPPSWRTLAKSQGPSILDSYGTHAKFLTSAIKWAKRRTWASQELVLFELGTGGRSSVLFSRQLRASDNVSVVSFESDPT